MNPTFNETQRFNKWWHYLLMSFPLIGTVTTTFLRVEDTERSNPTGMYISIGVALIVTFWFLMINLKTTIKESEIVAHFYGMPFCKREFLWNEIQSIEVVEYSPMMDYGGWGIRHGSGGSCYNVAGKTGIRINKINGDTFLIGTQQKEEAETIINQYFKK